MKFVFADRSEYERTVHARRVPSDIPGVVTQIIAFARNPLLRASAAALLAQGRWRTIMAFLRTAHDRRLQHSGPRGLADDLLRASTRAPARLPEISDPVCVVIPVFNSLAHLRRLCATLFHATDRRHPILFIDDASSDADVPTFLERIRRDHPNVQILRNEKNLGFTASVNRGAKEGNRNFVILTTDTEVTPGWLDRLMAPILRDPAIGSATPMSNSAELVSFPIIGTDNEPFLDLDTATIDAAFSSLPPDPIEAPTGVGFCMGISIAAWHRVGPLDEQEFGRGYGEENDWCQRAIREGFRNVVVPNLFVYHRHGGTFGSEEKRHLQTRNLARLTARYPTYQADVQGFMVRDPLAGVRGIAALIIAGRAGRLAVVFDHAVGGGANRYRHHEVGKLLAAGNIVLRIQPADRDVKIVIHTARADLAPLYLSSVDPLAAFLSGFRLGTVLVNHTMGFPAPSQLLHTIRTISKSGGGRLVVVFHDFFALCPSYHLLHKEEYYCNVPPVAVCHRCLPANRFAQNPENLDIEEWRRRWGEFLDGADELRFFSESSRALAARVFPSAAGRGVVQPHPLHVKFTPVSKSNLSSDLCLGVIGAIGIPKGSQVVQRLAEALRHRSPKAKVVVIGELEAAKSTSNLSVTGRYEVEQLPTLVKTHRINMVLVPSIVPETFSYVLTETIQLGLPAVCFDLGAQAERVRIYPLGRILSSQDPEVVVDEILAFDDELRAGRTQ